MMVLKRKQVVVLSLVFMIIVGGYLQFTSNKGSESARGKDTGKLGEAVYVENKDDTSVNADVSSKTSSSAVQSASKEANDFFAQAKLDKEVSRGRNIDSLKAITEDPNASKEVKAKAYDQEMSVLRNSEKEQKIETLLKEKGFSDTVALIGDDGSLDIVIKAPKLTSAQTAQVTDIVTRQANVSIDKLHVKNIY
ncbi:MAG TPA: SpoIIIAH-like family protein [Clostridia bacterium]